MIWTFGEIIGSRRTSAFVADRSAITVAAIRRRSDDVRPRAVVGPIVGTSIYHVSRRAVDRLRSAGSVGGLALAAGRRPASAQSR